MIIAEMASSILRQPDVLPSEPAYVVALMLAGAAWNSAVGDNVMLDKHRELVEQVDWSEVPPWAELRSDDTHSLIAELVAYKRERHSGDLRRIVATEMTPEREVQIHWDRPEKIVNVEFGSGNSRAKRGHPIADKLLKKMARQTRGKVVELKAVMLGRANATELQATVVSREDLADYRPACK